MTSDFTLAPHDRAELQVLISNRITARKLVWRWQARYLDEGVEGLKRDKRRPSRVPPLPMETRLKVIARTVQETPPNATRWSRSLMAEAMGVCPPHTGQSLLDFDRAQI